VGQRGRVLAGAAISRNVRVGDHSGAGLGAVGYLTSQWTAGLRLHAAAWIPWAGVGQLALLDCLRAGGRRWRLGVVKAALPTAFAFLMGELFLAMMGVVSPWRCWPRRRSSNGGPIVCRPNFLVAGLLRLRWPCCSLAARAPWCCFPRVRTCRRAIGRRRSREQRPKCIRCTAALHRVRRAWLHGRCLRRVSGRPLVGEASADGLPLSYSVYMGASVLALALAASGASAPWFSSWPA